MERDAMDEFIACSIILEKEEEEASTEIFEPVTVASMSFKDVVINPALPKKDREDLRGVVKEFAQIFSDIPGKSKTVKHHIRLTSNIPVKIRPYAIPHHYVSKVIAEIEELERLKIIQRSTSNYSSPMVIIQKKDGSLRICIDYRKLNEVTIIDAEPIPRTDDLIACMQHNSIFSKLDMTKGYYQIPMTASSKHLTAFSTPKGLYEFNYMPFGLVNAPATFVRMTRSLLKDIPNIATYIDDMCVYTATVREHLNILSTVFSRIQSNGLTIKPTKCVIGFNEVHFLGYKISQGIQATDETIVQKIMNISPPKTRKHVQALLGLINYYAKFIPCFSDKTAVLSSLLKKGKGTKIIWSENCQRILEEIKAEFSKEPILRLPNFDLPFIIRTDASKAAISGCLGQMVDGIFHPCLYISRKLNNAEKNYSTVELEALAVVYTVSKLKTYLLGRQFTIQSDNQPLKVITTGIPKNARIARWALILQDYKFVVTHIPGGKNCLADLLSRL
ncbi:hypothetical protein BsWGS_15631 [Bradybaena similaris]